MSKQKNSGLQSIFTALVTIVTLLCLMLGTVVIVKECCKIVATGAKLIKLSDNAQFYNESYRKTDEMTEDYKKNIELRQEIYNSEDTTIRIFSNLPSLIKMLVWMLSILAIPSVPFLVLVYIYKRIYIFKKRWERRHGKHQKSMSKGAYSKSV